MNEGESFKAIKEVPGASTPWSKVNQLLTFDERFVVQFNGWKGFILTPKHASQLAALLYFFFQGGISFCIQGRGTQMLLPETNSVIVSTRAFSEIRWSIDGVVEVGAGSLVSHLHQFLFERNQEIPLEDKFLDSSKRSLGGSFVSGNISGLRYRRESFSEALLGLEMVTRQGAQVIWGGAFKGGAVGPSLHKLMGSFDALPAIITKLIFKTYPIPPKRLRLSWVFRQRESLWRQFNALKAFSNAWEYLDVVLSGDPSSQGFIFAQLSGLLEEMEVFSRVCPGIADSSQGEERLKVCEFLREQKLKSCFVEKDYSPNDGEYLWVQHRHQKAWLFMKEFDKQNLPDPFWKQILRQGIS